MHYITVEDFFEKAAACKRLSREEERACATAMDAGDSSARERLVQSYLPSVAGHIRRCLPHKQTLKHLYSCLSALEKAVDSFNFLQDSETFSHRLSWWLRQATTRYIAERSDPNI